LGGLYWAYGTKNSVNKPISSLSQVANKPAESLIGKRAELKTVLVKTSGDDDIAFWIYDPSNQGRRVLVYLNFDLQGKAHLANNSARLKDGQKVKVSGTLKAPPSAEIMQTSWKLNAEDASAAAQQGIYLEADNLEVLK
jgi:hypothetical protein